ncbi:hypothetical protein AAK894_02705 [Lachnospiraceae bacterium 46-61]
MSIIKIQTAFLYSSLNIVIVGGEIKGHFQHGDVLYNIDNTNEYYIVKGIALLKPSNGYRCFCDIQLYSGNYIETELIGKTLTNENVK